MTLVSHLIHQEEGESENSSCDELQLAFVNQLLDDKAHL